MLMLLKLISGTGMNWYPYLKLTMVPQACKAGLRFVFKITSRQTEIWPAPDGSVGEVQAWAGAGRTIGQASGHHGADLRRIKMRCRDNVLDGLSHGGVTREVAARKSGAGGAYGSAGNAGTFLGGMSNRGIDVVGAGERKDAEDHGEQYR